MVRFFSVTTRLTSMLLLNIQHRSCSINKIIKKMQVSDTLNPISCPLYKISTNQVAMHASSDIQRLLFLLKINTFWCFSPDLYKNLSKQSEKFSSKEAKLSESTEVSSVSGSSKKKTKTNDSSLVSIFCYDRTLAAWGVSEEAEGESEHQNKSLKVS